MINKIQHILINAIQDQDISCIENLIHEKGDNILERAVCEPKGFLVSDCLACIAITPVLEVFMRYFPKIIYYGDSENTTLFERAVIYHNYDVITELLEVHPELLEQTNQFGYTPLFVSLLQDNYESYETIKYLLKKGASPNAKPNSQFHPLNFCIQNKDPKFVTLLQEWGAVNYYTTHQPIHLAILADNADVVNRLLKHKPELLYSKDNEGQTLLVLAARYSRQNVLSLLLDRYKPEVNCYAAPQELTPLSWAIINKDSCTFQKLQSAGAESPSKTSVFLQLNASHAAKNNDFDFLKQLLEKHPELLNSIDINGNAPIVYAVANGHYKIVNYLVDLGADLTVKYHKPKSERPAVDMLTIAIQRKYKHIVLTLLCTIPKLPNDIALHIMTLDTIIHLAKGYQVLSQKGILTEECIQLLLEHPRPLNLALSYCKLHDENIDVQQNRDTLQNSARPFTLSIAIVELHKCPWIDSTIKDKIIQKLSLYKYEFQRFNSASFEENRLIKKESDESPIVDQYYYRKALASTYREYRTFFSTINPQLSSEEKMQHNMTRPSIQ